MACSATKFPQALLFCEEWLHAAALGAASASDVRIKYNMGHLFVVLYDSHRKECHYIFHVNPHSGSLANLETEKLMYIFLYF